MFQKYLRFQEKSHNMLSFFHKAISWDLTSTKPTLHWSESAAIIYLTLPLFVFFLYFVRLEISIPSCLLIASFFFQIIKQTKSFSFTFKDKSSLFFLMVAILWVWLSGGIFLTQQNSDWLKHYSIINFLSQNTWPPSCAIGDIDEAYLRYSLGFYLVPSLFIKFFDLKLVTLAISTWTFLGVFIFFKLLPPIVGNSRFSFIVIPLFFVFFGGADIVGTLITKHQHGPLMHLEWWAGWIEFPSNTTSIFWVPQHAISAWLGTALLLNNKKYQPFSILILIFAGILLWSPFSAIGLIPFFAITTFKLYAQKDVFSLQTYLSTALLCFSVFVYLTESSANIPKGFIWSTPCIFNNSPCFDLSSYFIFLLLEVGLWVAVVYLSRTEEKILIFTASLIFILVPLLRIGLVNDFAMRACLPALTLLAIASIKTLLFAPLKFKTSIIILMLIALPTSFCEIYRGFTNEKVDPQTTFFGPWASEYLHQYLAPYPSLIIKKNDSP